MSYDALMRWEWEGGNPAFVNEWDDAPHPEPARNDALTRPRPTTGRGRVRHVATAWPTPPEGQQDDDRER